MQISGKNGILFSSGDDLFIDASGIRNRNALITHAHSDHAKPSASNTYYLTPETYELLDPKKLKNAVKVPFNKEFECNGFSCKFLPSGHILGSCQVELFNSSKAVLTSDFKLQDSILFKGAPILQADTLVIETTFGVPEFSFPPRELVYEDMMLWVNKNISQGHFIVIGGYSTGKAQELTKVITEFLGETPLVYSKIFEQNQAYEKCGVKLGDYIELNHNLKDANILIMPPHLIDDSLLSALSHQLGKKVVAAIATGWKNHSRYKTFPLSDHADFKSLLKYVEESSPSLVLTTHGFEKEFANHVRRRLGINARPLSQPGQKFIGEFSSNHG